MERRRRKRVLITPRYPLKEEREVDRNVGENYVYCKGMRRRRSKKKKKKRKRSGDEGRDMKMSLLRFTSKTVE